MEAVFDFLRAAVPWIGISLGMLPGLMIGTCIKKEEKDDEE